MKRKYIQMSMLIQGPTQPGNDINMYLELLKEELETLWAEEGVDTWDAVAEEYFPLRAALITTVQDYLGYGYISCQVCHGHKACVRCMEETMFLQLGKDPGSSKTVYMGHQRWLQKTDPWRKRGDLFDGTNEPRGPPRKKSGEEIDTLLKGWKECPAPGKIGQKPGEKKKKKATTPLIGVWKRRSVFWDLPYWKILDTPHCLDVMHITKNVCESLLGTLLNMPDRTKDGPKARHDLKVLGIREELQIPAAQEGQSEEEADGGVRVPFGYSGLISRYMDPKKRNLSGMKSHDCHVMMMQILPVAIRGIMDDHVRATLTGLCNFFDVITRKSISVKKLARLQEEIVVILCELEMYFPPAFFDVMVHLLVHIMDDIVSLGPAFLHNMMPFERMNGVIKGYVRNRSHPDGSIVQGWLTEECISFCTNYLDIEDPVGLPQNKHLRRFEGVGHKNGRKELHVHMSGRTSDFDRANLVALQHIDLIDPWLKEHKTMIENSGKPMMTEAEIYREHNSSFARWFKDHIDANPPPMDSDKDKLVLALSHGPAPNIMTYQAYDINGYTFYTEEKDKNSVYQNSGVTMDSWTGDVKTRYYGRIEEIWELSYAGEKVPMFRIRWAKSVTKEDRYFTTMFLPEANKSKSTNATAQNEPWVLAEHVHQCFFITDPSRPSRVIVRRGKRTIVGMDGVANEEDFEGQVGDPMMEESEDEDTTYTTRRSRTTLPRKRTPDEAEELLAKISKNHDDWSTPEPTPTPILKKRGMIELNDEYMREAKKSLMEKGIKSEDVKNLPPIEDLCEIIPPSSTIEDPLYPEGHPKRIEQDSQRTKEISGPSKKNKKKHKTVVESSEPVNDPNSISISDAETESGNEHDEDNDKNDAPDKEEIEKEPEKHDKNKKYTKEDFITKKHGILQDVQTLISNAGLEGFTVGEPYQYAKLTVKGWSVTENELNAYIEREGHHARDGTEEAEEHLDSSSDAASSSYQHYGHVEPPRHSSAQGPYYHSMYDPSAWNPDPRWE
ncbi:hypothetical protein QYE76_064115 [Lolium multiflorum]|uniref:DUF4218 domain-containing protein n=1 Tax=Lolium multiflorum TaxID=4521 RepID=A0AAD8W8U7_LOLMU|nr:hypothetical protein QYE76_064115 [Lolium multiflorum]